MQVQETVRTFPNLSRKELATTLCEHLRWTAPNGAYKIPSCLKLLEKLEKYGMITLPAARQTKKPQHPPAKICDAQNEPIIECTLDEIGSIELLLVESKEDRERWKVYLKKHHYLGYRHAVATYLGYIIHSKTLNRDLGCFLFSGSPAFASAPRDQWIGWQQKHRTKLLHLIVNQSRFLIFPWVKVPNLASKVLSLATQRIGDDWLRFFAYRPVLLETFVDTTKYDGTCYQAANWRHIGQTQARQRETLGENREFQRNVKDIYMYPLVANFQHRLTNDIQVSAQKKRYRNDVRLSHSRSVDEGFVKLWEKVAHIVRDTAAEYDEKWRMRKRLIDSMFLILFIFRLVSSKNMQGYGATLDELWDSAKKLDLPLPQKSAMTPSSVCEARQKLSEDVFRTINQRVIETYEDKTCATQQWLGHRLFAVDGSKINLPRPLFASGHTPPSDHAHYPQGLLSCLYQLKSKIPYDFDLTAHKNERIAAKQHLKVLNEGDVVVYDRGYFSYFMLHQHLERGIHAIFRLQDSGYQVIQDFFTSESTDTIVTIDPSDDRQRKLRKDHPDLKIVPLTMRLIQYSINGSTFCLGTTLLDANSYPRVNFEDVYHARWGIEELYKVSKHIFMIEEFHAKSEHGVRQEIFAHFALITMNRIFSNHTDTELNSNISPPRSSDKDTPRTFQTNFKACAQVFTRSIEALLFLHDKVRAAVANVYECIAGRYQAVRHGRSYERKSMKPVNKWRSPQKKKTKKIGAPVQVSS